MSIHKYTSNTKTFCEGEFVIWRINSMDYDPHYINNIQRNTDCLINDNAFCCTISGTGKIIDSNWGEHDSNYDFLQDHCFEHIIPDDIVELPAKYYLIQTRKKEKIWVIASSLEDCSRYDCDDYDTLKESVLEHEYLLWRENDFAYFGSTPAKFDINEIVEYTTESEDTSLQVELQDVYHDMKYYYQYKSKMGYVFRRIWYEHPFSEDEVGEVWWRDDTCDECECSPCFYCLNNCLDDCLDDCLDESSTALYDCNSCCPDFVIEDYCSDYVGWLYAVIMSFNGQIAIIYTQEDRLTNPKDDYHELSINDIDDNPILVDKMLSIEKDSDTIIDGIFCTVLIPQYWNNTSIFNMNISHQTNIRTNRK